MTGADVIADVIVARGLTRVFTFPGGTIAPLLDALSKRGVELFVGRSEQGSAHAALAVARLTGVPQVVLVTSGPGVTNVATVVADAYFDSTPLVVLCGQVGTSDLNRHYGLRQRGFQEADTAMFMQPISRIVLKAYNIDKLRDRIELAFRWSMEDRPGPVVIDLPMDIQKAEVNA
jgi:acetolactate synthase I/II/III large subunit